MPKFVTKDLLNSLENDVKLMLDKAKSLQVFDSTMLNTPPAPGKWSILQVIEHLNSYNRYYIPELENALQRGRHSGIAFNAQFKSGWFGDYFTKMMMPGEGGKISNKMNAPKDHRPVAQQDADKVITEFLAGEQKLISLLQMALSTDMGKLRLPISISRLIKLKAGDTFRFLIAHQQRHFVQLQNAMNVLELNKSAAYTA
jgi:hypothetical protein